MFMSLKRAALSVAVFGVFLSGLMIGNALIAQKIMAEPAPLPVQSIETTLPNADDSALTVDPAAESNSHESDGAHGGVVHFGVVFAMFALVLIMGKLGNFIERYGQPAVLGELFAGVLLSALGYFGWGFIAQTSANEAIAFIANFGALLLLFSIGLESNIRELIKVGPNSLAVAAIGVVLPFVLGTFVLGEIFYGDESTNALLFLGAALVATSVGITSSVLKSLNLTRTRAAKTFLGATVIDDVIGLILLAVVSALASGGEASLSMVLLLSAKAFGFLAGAIIFGSFLTKPLSRLFRFVHKGTGMKIGLALSFALVFSFLAEVFGLEPIIGAFAAGLLLDAVHFENFADPDVVNDMRELEFEDVKDREKVLRLINKHKHSHVEDLISNLSYIFVPVFFVHIGLQVDFASLLQPRLYLVAGFIAIVAFVAKVLAGFAAKGPLKEKLLVGVAMAPRGEVGLIFAATGKSLGVLTDELFSVIVLVVIITTFIAPPLIKRLAPAPAPQ